MPKFILQDTETGRELEVEGATEPTQAEVASLFAEAYPAKSMGQTVKDTGGDIAVEVGGAVAGQMVGGIFGPAGMAVGGAAGGAVGNTVAQFRRMARGEQADFKWGELAGATVASAIPGAPFAKGAGTAVNAARVAKTGAKIGFGTELATQVIDEGKLDPARLAIGTAVGAVAGGVFGVAEAKLMASRFGRVKSDDLVGKTPEQAAKTAAAIEGIAEKDAAAVLGAVEGDVPKPEKWLSADDIKTRADDFGRARVEEAAQTLEPDLKAAQVGAQESIVLGENPVQNQITRLDVSLGEGQGAVKERSRLSRSLPRNDRLPSAYDTADRASMSPQAQRMMDEYGRVNPAVLQSVGGAAIGGVAGSTQGETPQERAQNALIGAGLGATLPLAIRKAVSAKLATAASDATSHAMAVALPEVALGAMTKALRDQGPLSASLTRDGLKAAQDLKKALKGATPAQADVATQLLWGNNMMPLPPGSDIPLDLARAVTAARDSIDDLQGKLITLGVAKGDRADMVKDSIGRYARRAYEVFENPAYTVPANDPRRTTFISEYVRDAVASGSQKTPAELTIEATDRIQRLLHKGTGGALDAASEFLTTGGASIGKNGEVWKPRKQVDDAARALLGEIKDPVGIVSQTVPRLAKLISAHQTQKELRSVGLATGMFSPHATPTHSVPLTAAGTHASNPVPGAGSKAFDQLQDLFTTPDVATALKSWAGYDDWGLGFRALATVTAASKVSKTVLNPASYAPNLISSMLGVAQNGHIRGFLSSDNWQKASLIVADDMGLMRAPAALEKEIKFLVEQRLISQSVNFKDLQLTLDNVFTNLPLVGSTARGVKTTIEKAGKVYGGSEDLGRVLGFYAEKNAYRKALPNLSEAELNLRTAEVVRAAYPNYSEIPKGVKKLSGVGALNAFVNFTYEQVRNGVNIFRLAARDIEEGQRTGNKALVALGSKRAATYSMFLAAGSAVGLAAYSKREVGVSDEEEAALRRRAPSFDQKGMWYFHSLDSKEFAYSNQSYILPTSIVGGIVSQIVGAKEPVDVPQAFISAMWDQFGGDGGLILKPLAEAFVGRNAFGGQIAPPESTAVESAAARGSYFIDRAATPLVIKEVQRGILAANGQPGPDGQVYTLEDRATRLMGARVTRLNLETRFEQQAHGLGARLSASQEWRAKQDRMAQGGQEGLDKSYQAAEAQRQKVFTDTVQYIKDAATLKQPFDKTIANLRGAGLGSEFILGALDGKYVPGPKDKAAANQEIVDWLQNLPEEKRKVEENRLLMENRGLALFMRSQKRDEMRGMTARDQLVKSLEIPGGTRAKWIQGQLDGLQEYDEKKSFIQDLQRKRLLTPEVVAQMKGLRAPKPTMVELKSR